MTTFFVHGIPAPGGSKKAFFNPKTHRIVVTDDAKRNRPWRDMIASTALAAGVAPIVGPIRLSVTFRMPRPKSHYRSDGTIKPNAPRWHVVRPDATKLLRALEDALTGIAWRDDSEIARQDVVKEYTDSTPGASVVVSTIE